MKKFELKEFFTLLWISFTVFIYNLKEFLYNAFHYFGRFRFFKVEMCLLLMYLFRNPFSISKRFLMERGEKEIYLYGETPLSSMEMIAKEAKINSKDHVFELGCGRGEGCFWLREFCEASVTGIEYVPEFIEKANRIKQLVSIEGIEFVCADMLNVDYNGATVCYLYGTCLEDSAIRKLAVKFSHLPVGTKIITVSYSLLDYIDRDVFEVMKRFTVPFTWGQADVFLHVVKKSISRKST